MTTQPTHLILSLNRTKSCVGEVHLCVFLGSTIMCWKWFRLLLLTLWLPFTNAVKRELFEEKIKSEVLRSYIPILSLLPQICFE